MTVALHAAEENLLTPPVVTARAWAIADGDTGELLWNLNAEQPRKTASTTKIMCAYTVLLMAKEDPAVLEERVTFSQLAGTTTGSSAAIMPGESVTVRDCLYGLLLPSGNDAGNALAEHFHPRLAPPDEAMLKAGLDHPRLSTRVNFIAEMNRVARRIGLKRTVYRSAFGDGGTDHDRTTTAADLVRLSWHAMQSNRFRQCVATRRYQCEVLRADGTPRKALWENSNKLLSLGLGYDGIKTGLTNQAGYCLVASGHHDGDRLFVVVLNCDSEDACAGDARNLFRWAWDQRRQ